ncbi:DUF1657 domain-containing protein [Heliophilum fasciatum]|uniref:Uncharacterized protein DUF1657 n=1 Tax=Heliophilum fasciatum TaxID=35700 RepID=A0A4R2RMX3_9FIRM|nr:DUF1657 domain-containing protein [Heliophilum fasciatum]MCW2277996.1 hypothetical protein [Heliophilum fasciatum]TCP64384.1 uncharacterized protein DUF1657 [Heliophilum fasciatum]
MTVSSQVKQTLASVKGARSTLQSFAIIEENQEAHAIFSRNIDRLDQVIADFERRVQELEFAEPQYKGF